MQTPTMDLLRWMRIVGDTIFAAGLVALGWFVMGLKTGWSIRSEEDPSRGVAPPITASAEFGPAG
jgi:nitric oxide reductase subunit B